jgi:predicted small secreted protein
MKTDKVILGVLGGLAAGAIMGIFALKRKKKKEEGKLEIQAMIMQMN